MAEEIVERCFWSIGIPESVFHCVISLLASRMYGSVSMIEGFFVRVGKLSGGGGGGRGFGVGFVVESSLPV